MRITESGLRRIIRQEVRALREISSPYGLYNEVDPVPGVRGTWRDRAHGHGGEDAPGPGLRARSRLSERSPAGRPR